MRDGKRVPEADRMKQDAFGFPDWGDGWTYSADPPAVTLHGTSIPEPSTAIIIYYDVP